MNSKSILRHIAIVCTTALFSFNYASALDVQGVTVNGEADFDYNSLSSGTNTYPASGSAGTEQYRFNQAQLTFKKDTSKFSFLGRLNYTPTDTMSNSTTTNRTSLGTLDQIEIYYKLNQNWSAGFGRFATMLGFESLMRSENNFYTNSITGQAIVPGYSEGLRLRYMPSDAFNMMLSTYNQSTNNAYGDKYTPSKTTEVAFTGTKGRITWFAGHHFGLDQNATDATKADSKKMSDFWLTYKFSDYIALSLIYDDRVIKYEDGTVRFAQSSQALLSWTQGMHTFGVRYESLLGASDLDTLNGSTGTYYSSPANKVNVLSIADKFAVNENLKLYVEWRHDSADQESILDRNSLAKKNGDMYTLAAVASF